MPRGVDAEMLLTGYHVALQDEPIGALENVVMHLVKGTWREEVKFCPRPPELANMVREEQRRIDAVNRPRLPPPAAVPHEFKDIRVTHRLRAEELAKLGHVLVAEGITREAFCHLAKSRGIPAGSIHLWAIDEVWAPTAVAPLVDTHKVEAKRKAEQGSYTEPMTPEKAEYWRKINALKDAPEITAEQQAFRRKIEMELPPADMKDAAE